MWRARKPKSYWVTPEWVALKEVTHALELQMYQAGGGKGKKPDPPKIPQDKEAQVKTPEQLRAARAVQREHLKRRRAQRDKGR